MTEKEDLEKEETVEEAQPEEKAEQEEKDGEKEKIAELETKIKEWEDKYTRLYAEYDNYQKRSKREKDARYADAVVDVISSILPVADNLDRALASEASSEEIPKRFWTAWQWLKNKWMKFLQSLKFRK